MQGEVQLAADAVAHDSHDHFPRRVLALGLALQEAAIEGCAAIEEELRGELGE